jgi:hypothetical protein
LKSPPFLYLHVRFIMQVGIYYIGPLQINLMINAAANKSGIQKMGGADLYITSCATNDQSALLRTKEFINGPIAYFNFVNLSICLVMVNEDG